MTLKQMAIEILGNRIMQFGLRDIRAIAQRIVKNKMSSIKHAISCVGV